jgi:hypothetical protein
MKRILIVPLLLLPVIFLWIPNAIGAFIWQTLSVAWMLYWFKKEM